MAILLNLVKSLFVLSECDIWRTSNHLSSYCQNAIFEDKQPLLFVLSECDIWKTSNHLSSYCQNAIIGGRANTSLRIVRMRYLEDEQPPLFVLSECDIEIHRQLVRYRLCMVSFLPDVRNLRPALIAVNKVIENLSRNPISDHLYGHASLVIQPWWTVE